MMFQRCNNIMMEILGYNESKDIHSDLELQGRKDTPYQLQSDGS